MGLETPYVEPTNEPPLEDYYNEPFMRHPGESMSINGQKISCVIDGIEQVDFTFCARAGESARVDENNSSKEALNRLGYWRWNSDSGRSAPKVPNKPDTDETIFAIGQGDGGVYEYVFDDNSFQKAVKRMTPCEKYIRDMFFDENVVFHDTWEQKGVQFNPIDPFYNKQWTYPPNNAPDDHAYPDWTDSKNFNANVYLPKEAELLTTTTPFIKGNPKLGKFDNNDDGFAMVYLPNIGKKGVTVALVHIIDAKEEKLPNGRTKIGTFGSGTGGDLRAFNGSGRIIDKDWIHIHLNLYEDRVPRRNDRRTKKTNAKIPLSTLCPKNMR